jgi:8-oxo-dGTP diphosphatase
LTTFWDKHLSAPASIKSLHYETQATPSIITEIDMDKKTDKIHVVAAVIKDGDKYLCMQRLRSRQPYNSERWEFPGGKVEEGESEPEALLREISEEMLWDIYVGKKLGTIEHQYPDFNIQLSAYLCKPGDGDFTLLYHLDARWLTLEELDALNWSEADRKIIKKYLSKD